MSSLPPIAGPAENVVDRFLPNPLRLDEKPQLSTDLDAGGHCLMNVADVQCKTINGKNPYAVIQDELMKLSVANELSFARKDHTHPEFSSMKGLIDNLSTALTGLPESAEKDHTHPLAETEGTLPLARVEKGLFIDKLLARSLADADHRHIGLETSFDRLKKEVIALRDGLSQLALRDDVFNLSAAMGNIGLEVTREIEAIRNLIPKPPEREAEVIGIKRIHIPAKASGLKITQIVGRDDQSTPVKVSVTRSGKEIGIGEAVSADDILLLTPANASVRIRFS